MTRHQAGLLLLVAHTALMGSLGLKLLADRQRLPRGWARTVPFDPSTPLRGRYVRLALEIPLAIVPPEPSEYRGSGVRLRAVDGKVVGDLDDSVRSPRVQLRPEGGARSPREELWAEVTIPRTGPPRPIRLGVMKAGRLKPLDLR